MQNISSGKLDIGVLQEFLSKELLSLIDKCDGTKAIFWEKNVGDPMGLVIKLSVLREHNVKHISPLSFGNLPKLDVRNVIFITRANCLAMDMVAKVIRSEENRGDKKDYHIFFVPRVSDLCIDRLKNKGVFGSLTVAALPCDIFPFDSDLLSMEINTAFKEYYIQNDPTSLYNAAEAVMLIQSLYGLIPRISGKGNAAKHVWDIINRLSLEPREFPSISQIDHLILMDRAVDLISPFATQLTYEGLIDEIYEIKNTAVHLPAEKFSQSEEPSQLQMLSDKKIVILNSSDELYAEIRDKNFNAVAASFAKKAKLLSAQLKYSEDTSVKEIKQYVERLPHMMAAKNSLSTHTKIAELIKSVTDSGDFLDSLQLEQELMLGVDTDKVQTHIEDLIAHKAPLFKVLRLICLQSATNSGLKPKVLEYYKREIIQTYGFEHIISLSNLEKAGFVKIQQGRRPYTVLRKTLRLTVEDNNEVSPTDIHYVHSVYAPLSVRLVGSLLKPGGWKALSDVMHHLPGPTIETVQQNNHQPKRRSSISSQSSQSDGHKVVMVFFLGGCTFAEISALRFLSQQEDANMEFLIATTQIVSGNSFLKSVMEPLKT